jgi:hypothetical protein
MRLPRRVPWTSIGELDQVCFWIFANELDARDKILAVNRVSAWYLNSHTRRCSFFPVISVESYHNAPTCIGVDTSASDRYFAR